MPGTWETRIRPWPPAMTPNTGLRAVHMVHLKTGKIMVIGGAPSGAPFETVVRLWDPDDPLTSEGVDNSTTDLFCCGHSALADGRTLVAGGNWDKDDAAKWLAPKDVNVFDPDLKTWRIPVYDMAFKRWYPTCTTLWDGNVLISSGYQSREPGPPVILVRGDKLEIFHPTDGLSELVPTRIQDVYAMMFVVPDGTLFDTGPWRDLFQLTPGTPWEWSTSPLERSPNAGMGHGSAVMYDAVAGLILKSGGARLEVHPGVKTTALFKYDKWIAVVPDPQKYWKLGPDMVHARRNHNLVMLPNGTVLCVGGNLVTTNENPVTEAEIYDPAANTWTGTGVDMSDPRWYHSTALLLADARVLTAGGDEGAGYTDNTAQIFKPPTWTATRIAPRSHRYRARGAMGRAIPSRTRIRHRWISTRSA